VTNSWLLHHVSYFLFHEGFFDRKQMPVVPDPPIHPPFLFRRLKTKLKGHHFDTIQVIEAESQAALNTLTEHDFRNAFKKWQKR
jgi:hypothetical protein